MKIQDGESILKYRVLLFRSVVLNFCKLLFQLTFAEPVVKKIKFFVYVYPVGNFGIVVTPGVTIELG